MTGYQLLEPTFQNQPRYSLNKTTHIQRGQVLSKTIAKPIATSGPTYSPEKIEAHSDGSTPSSPLIPPYTIHRDDAGLPPTPPSHSNDRDSRSNYNPSMRVQSGAGLSDHKTLAAITTPTNARSPPTPDTTPPISRLPAQDNLSRMSSSRAESFSTAREEQWSSDEERKSRNEKFRVPSESGARMEHTLRHARSRDTWQDDLDTPAEHVPASPKARKVFTGSRRTNTGSLNQLPDGGWDTNLMRNVTVRRKKPPQITSPKKHDDDNRIKEREILPKLVMGSSEEEELGPTTPCLTDFGQTIGWPKATNQTRIRDSDSRRLSDMSSHSTTVVEAIVTVSPPRRLRTLRHVSRNLSLRAEAGSSAGSTPSPKSTRTSFLSKEIPSKRLTHTRVSIPNTSPRGSGNLQILVGAGGQYLPNNHYSSSGANADSPGDRERTLDPPPALGSYHQRSVSAVHVPIASDLSGLTKCRMSSLQAKPSKAQSPIRVQFEDSLQYSMRRATSDKKRESYPTRLATQRALRQVDGLAALPAPKVVRSSTDEQFQAKPGSPTSLEILHAFPSPGKSSLKQTILSTSERSRSRPSIDASTSGSVRRVSFDRSTIGTYELARTSPDRSHLHPDDSRAGRPLLTPFSENSDHQHEISEATAVNLYPHNNNSLLVVQQMARSAEIQSSGVGLLDIPGGPALTLQPATPPMSPDIIHVDSPLRHPRQPPHPPLQAPVIRISPATPSEELETSPLDGAAGRPGLPKRSLSFKEHAIQFSETLMQPIFPKSNSFQRRSAYQRKQRSESTQKANTLHPFWQPRGFWDEFSDSEDDSDEGDDRLPPGGDTSDVVLPRSMATRVLDSVRSSGGFMIGNSLGVERAGSNKRRHHVSLPVGLGKRTSSHVLRSSSQGTLRSLKSLESLSRQSHKMKKWNPKNWRVQYVGIGGMREMWKEKQAVKRRQKLRDSIGVRYMVEGAPVV